MIDPSEMETTAMGACLHPLGEFVGSIGMDRPLASYSRIEVLTLIDVVVTAYQCQMTAEHERMAARDRAFWQMAPRGTRWRIAYPARLLRIPGCHGESQSLRPNRSDRLHGSEDDVHHQP
mgnify:CR=1 FL=1